MISKNVLEQLEFHKVLEYISKYSSTDGGKQAILNSKPFSNPNDAIEHGNLISEAKELIISKDLLPISYLPSLKEIIFTSRIENSILRVEDVQNILQLAEVSRRCYSYLKYTDEEFANISNFAERLFVDKNFEHQISRIFTPSGEIIDNASSKLQSIRTEIRDKNDLLRKVVSRILKKLSESYLVQEDYSTQRDGRIVLPVKAEHKRHVKGFIHSESGTGQTVYIEPEETLELNNEILSLHFAEKREIERIIKSLTKLIGDHSDALLKSYDALVELDEIFANAKYSTEVLGAFPLIEQDNPINLLDCRHPILIKKIGRKNTIPLNIKIAKNNVIMITGPNAGGKTVVLKTFGLLNLLVMAGLHVPVNCDSNFHFYSNILIDIGDKQSIEDELSTFSSHLSNINSIVNSADSKSLILLDELGTGTDPAEGAALATGILFNLRDKGATVLATTHHGNLKVLAYESEGFENASMEFDTDKLEPTYYFKQGMPGSSYAFEVAKRIGLNEDILSSAKEFIDSNKMKLEEFLVEIEKKSNSVRKELRELEIENSRLEGLTSLYQKKNEELTRQKNKILSETKAKAENYLSDINKKFEATIKNIKESNADSKVIKQEKKEIETLKKLSELDFVEEKEEQNNDRDFKVGNYVKLNNSTTSGEIIELNTEKGTAILLVGSLKLNVKTNKLVKTKKPKNIHSSGFGTSKYVSEINSSRLDIRGKKYDDGEIEVIKFIDDAHSAGLNQIEILHGKGTGVLKQMVWAILKKHPAVKNYYYAKIEVGGDGITIVDLK